MARPLTSVVLLQFSIIVVAVLGLLSSESVAPTVVSSSLTVEGTEFVLQTPNGSKLRSRDLVGAVLKITEAGRQKEIVISEALYLKGAHGRLVVLHRLAMKDSTGRLVNICKPDGDGKALAFPLSDGLGGFEIACTSGAMAKCVLYGYRPWDQQIGGPPLAALHKACVRMLRADYGGDGRSYTREGKTVDFCDSFSINSCDNSRGQFEAGWAKDGATCVARPRAPDLVSLEQLAQRYARLRLHIGPSACSFAIAKSVPETLIYSRSVR